MSRQVCPGASVTLVCLAAGGPNSNDLGTNHILHHTIGSTDWHQEFRCFKEVTCAQVGRCQTLRSMHNNDRAVVSLKLLSVPHLANRTRSLSPLCAGADQLPRRRARAD